MSTKREGSDSPSHTSESSSAPSATQQPPQHVQESAVNSVFVVSKYQRARWERDTDSFEVIGAYSDVNTANIAAIDAAVNSYDGDDDAEVDDSGSGLTITYGTYSDESCDVKVEVTECDIDTEQSSERDVREALQENCLADDEEMSDSD